MITLNILEEKNRNKIIKIQNYAILRSISHDSFKGKLRLMEFSDSRSENDVIETIWAYRCKTYRSNKRYPQLLTLNLGN